MKTIIGTEVGCPYGKSLVEKRRAKEAIVEDCMEKLSNAWAADSSETRTWFITAGDETDKAQRITEALQACLACKGDPENAQMTDAVCPTAQVSVSLRFE